jgi:hypothetical protein
MFSHFMTAHFKRHHLFYTVKIIRNTSISNTLCGAFYSIYSFRGWERRVQLMNYIAAFEKEENRYKSNPFVLQTDLQRLYLTANMQLAVNIFHVLAHCMLAQKKQFGNLSILLAFHTTF